MIGKEIITFGDNEMKHRKFQRYKIPFLKEDVDIDNLSRFNLTRFPMARKL